MTDSEILTTKLINYQIKNGTLEADGLPSMGRGGSIRPGRISKQQLRLLVAQGVEFSKESAQHLAECGFVDAVVTAKRHISMETVEHFVRHCELMEHTKALCYDYLAMERQLARVRQVLDDVIPYVSDGYVRPALTQLRDEVAE